MIQLITGIISAITAKTIPGTQRTVGEFTNKTNGWASAVISFSIWGLTQNPESTFHKFLIVFCIFMVTFRDTATKLLTAIKELIEVWKAK